MTPISRAIVIAVALLGLAAALLRAPSQPTPGSGGSSADAATVRPVAVLSRPAGRFHPPAGGGERPWTAGVHELRDAAGKVRRVVLRPDGALARAEARALAHERAALRPAQVGGHRPVTATILVLPVQFGASASLDYQLQTPDRTACITVTQRFTGPLHGAIPYPGGAPQTGIDNQTVYYPSTEPEDYARLIFGRTGYTQPLRAGDPNVNGGQGVDIAGLTVERYYETQSDATVAITGTVAPWVTLDRPQAYYGLDVCIPNLSPRAIPDEQLGSLADMTVAAAEQLKARGGEYASHDFWQRLDTDGDGFVDGLWVMHAGRGQEYGGGSDGEAAIWSRSSDIADYEAHAGGHVIDDGGTPGDPTDDIRLGPFMLMPEDSDIGVLVEEFGHSFFGFPDLYTNDSENSMGWWGPMSAGIWGGELGGTRPVNMPLWFRSVADCGGTPCGWADPVAVISYTTAAQTVILGQAGSPAGGKVGSGPHAGQTIHEGLRVDLPVQQEAVDNRAGSGGGAYSGPESGSTRTMERELDLARLPAGDGPVLHLGADWNIPRYWGYFFVEVAAGGGDFQTLPDLDGRFSDENPFGLNDGWGLTGPGVGATTLRFDLTKWRNQTLRLRLRYITYRGGPGTGVWLDDAVLHVQELGQDLRFPIDDFNAGLGAWQVDGWRAVPYTLSHPHHYLVEWRNDEGWDKSLRGAYQTSYRDQDEWRVDRIPANLPGALVTYRNLKYPFSGALKPQLADLPSWGAKYGLLAVDPNFAPVTRPSGGPFGGQLQSLDAALAFGRQPDFSLEIREPGSRLPKGSETITGQPGARRFDDAHGYAPGLRVGADDKLTPWDEDGSVVLPSRDGGLYSTRVVGQDGRPATARYGEVYAGTHILGSGNPGDANLQHGVRIELVDQAPDGSWGALRVSNVAMDYTLETYMSSVAPGSRYQLDANARNRGAVARSITMTMVAALGDLILFEDMKPATVLAPGGRANLSHDLLIPLDVVPSDHSLLSVIARFDDGTDVWERRVDLPVVDRSRIWLPYLAAEH